MSIARFMSFNMIYGINSFSAFLGSQHKVDAHNGPLPVENLLSSFTCEKGFVMIFDGFTQTGPAIQVESLMNIFISCGFSLSAPMTATSI